MDKIIQELTEYLEVMQAFDKDSAQDGQVLNAYSIQLTNIMARSNFLMAEYNRKFREAKKVAYTNLHASFKATGQELKPMLAKDFVDSQCSEVGYVYDLAERTSRCATHTLDAIRSITISLMSERKFNNQAA